MQMYINDGRSIHITWINAISNWWILLFLCCLWLNVWSPLQMYDDSINLSGWSDGSCFEPHPSDRQQLIALNKTVWMAKGIPPCLEWLQKTATESRVAQTEFNQICQHSNSVNTLCVLVWFHLFAPSKFPTPGSWCESSVSSFHWKRVCGWRRAAEITQHQMCCCLSVTLKALCTPAW